MKIQNYIDAINKIKEDFSLDLYPCGLNLERDINDLSQSLLEEISDLEHQDLSYYSEVHDYLLQRVSMIHEEEKNSKITQLLKSNLDLKSSIESLPEGKDDNNIYIFNNEAFTYYIVGDIHSDLISLNSLLSSINFYEKVYSQEPFRVIFLGDYVDRGFSHLKVTEKLLTLKYLFPNHIILLRGNHDGGVLNEDGTITLPYRKPMEDPENYYFPLYLRNLSSVNPTFSKDLLKGYLDFFNTLGGMAFVKFGHSVALCVHGGLPRPKWDGKSFYSYLNNITDLRDVNILDNLNKSIVDNMLWSDPYRGHGDLKEGSGRFYFTEEHFKDFSNVLGIDYILRGHEAVRDGVKAHFNNKVYTVFSSGGEFNTTTAYSNVSPKLLQLTPRGEIIELYI